jgi:hypothetical protein
VETAALRRGLATGARACCRIECSLGGDSSA